MIWDDFSPYIKPWVTGCSAPLMELHVRLAAIDFCEFTNVWRDDLAPLACNGVLSSFTLTRPTDAEIAKVLAVTVNDVRNQPDEFGIRPPFEIEQAIRDGWTGRMASTSDRRVLRVWPVQPTGSTVVVTASLKPRLAATTFPDALFDQHGQDIADGAIATLLAIPSKDWTDTKTAAMKAGMFMSAKTMTARKVERGFAKGMRRSTTRWF